MQVTFPSISRGRPHSFRERVASSRRVRIAVRHPVCGSQIPSAASLTEEHLDVLGTLGCLDLDLTRREGRSTDDLHRKPAALHARIGSEELLRFGFRGHREDPNTQHIGAIHQCRDSPRS